MEKPSFSFPRERRLREKKAFERLFKEGGFAKERHAYMVFERLEEGSWQIAVVARKKDYRHACSRNLVKRRLREAVRLAQGGYLPFRGVLVAKRGLDRLPFQELQREWQSLCRRAGILGGEAPGAVPAGPEVPPSLAARAACGLIGLYRRFLSPLHPRCCRFTPTCSAYALEAVRRHGFWKGSWLGLKRLLRCHPFNPGGYDPVP